MKQTDTDDMDNDLKRLYARAPGAADGPPPELDRAILARAGSAVAAQGTRHKRQWAAPVAAAAVLMLGVGVVFNMQREQPEVLSATGSANERIAVAPPAKAADVAPAAPAASTSGPAILEGRAPAIADSRRVAPREASPPATAPLAAELRAPAASPAPFVDAAPAAGDARQAMKRSDFSAAGAAREAASRGVAGSAIAPPMEAQRKAANEAPALAAPTPDAYAPQPQAGVPVPPPRAQSAPPRSLLRADARGKSDAVTAALAGTNMTPEQWLEHLAALKAQGRTKELEEGLAAFRKRYPGFRIPDALLSTPRPAAAEQTPQQ